MRPLTLSIVSHGHNRLLPILFRDLAALPTLSRAKILLTLNLFDEVFDESAFSSLQIEVIRNPQPKGFGANHNAAFARCSSPWFAVLNPDLRFTTDSFGALLAAAESMPEIAVFTPRVIGADGKIEDHVRANLTLRSVWCRRCGRIEWVDDSRPSVRPDTFYWLAGMFMLFRAEPFKAVGGFDERFFLYCEDYDICARLYTRGYGLAVIHQTQVIHDAQRDSHRSLKHLRWHMSSLAKVWTSRAFWGVVLGRIRAGRPGYRM